MRALLFDLRSAARTLSRTPAFAVLAILTLALGIGANTAVFSIVDAVLFRPLPFADPDRLVRIFAVDRPARYVSNSSYPVYRDYRDGTRSFSGLAAYCDSIAVHVSLSGAAPERLTAAVVTGNFFGVLGVGAQRGRLIAPSDDRAAGANPIVVLADGFWRRGFAADPSAIGRTIRLNGRAVTVIGVAPPGFFGVSFDSLPDVWLPLSMTEQAEPEWGKEVPDRGFSWLDVVGRLKPGVSIAQAQAELDVLASAREKTQPEDKKDPWARVYAVRDAVVNPDMAAGTKRLSWILAGIVLLVLAIACADAAGLLLARSERRRREIAIRSALGASRSRLVTQFLFESILLAVAGGAAGLVIAWWLVAAIRALAPADFPIPLDAAAALPDVRVIAFAFAASLVTGAAFGLLPALRGSRGDLVPDLKGERGRGGSGSMALRDAFSAGQVALSAVLLVGAALLLRTLAAERTVAPGFDAERGVVFTVDLARQGYSEERRLPVFSQILESVRGAPGVRTAVLGWMIPIANRGMVVTIDRAPDARMRTVDLNLVGPGFYSALGVPLLAGREFRDSDTANSARVAVVNEVLAAKQWPGESPVGKVLPDVGMAKGPLTVVGVVANARFRSLRDPIRPMLSVPFAQFPRPSGSILVRTTGNPSATVPAIRAAVAGVDPDLPVYGVRTLRDRVAGSLGQERLLASLLAGFAALALGLSVAGIYGVVSSSVEARRREFGIRLALGADRRRLLADVLGRCVRVAAIGLAIGVPAALLASRSLATILFQVSPTDLASVAAAIAVLGAAAILSGALPARRAANTDPTESLRAE
ncbi:MAG TPA: ABC transporter permease [Thermoanaerobaculia bacterium]|nr:ABC transporter permease [Thermoanaerobaculia bacterium]